MCFLFPLALNGPLMSLYITVAMIVVVAIACFFCLARNNNVAIPSYQPAAGSAVQPAVALAAEPAAKPNGQQFEMVKMK